jgi:hypothetical protein
MVEVSPAPFIVLPLSLPVINVFTENYDDIGVYTISVTLTDGALSTSYSFQVAITNFPPFFLAGKEPPKELTLHLNDNYLFEMEYDDTETPN